jgi:hypothetical protein
MQDCACTLHKIKTQFMVPSFVSFYVRHGKFCLLKDNQERDSRVERGMEVVEVKDKGEE